VGADENQELFSGLTAKPFAKPFAESMLRKVFDAYQHLL